MDVEMTREPVSMATVEEWRAWLRANHAVEREVWLTIHKKHAAALGVTLVEATEEALAFGWIDSAMHPIDEDRYALRYTPRRRGSNWSEVNKERAERLIAEGRMTEAGLAAIEEAKRTGRWDRTSTRRGG
jgi:uncharacterized protein YdeI (YjbR/CyaY-like superfamily)